MFKFLSTKNFGAVSGGPNDVAFCPTYGKWVAVFNPSDPNYIMVSDNGIFWEPLAAPGSLTQSINSVRGTNFATTRGWIVIAAGSNGIWEMDSSFNWTNVAALNPTKLEFSSNIGFTAFFSGNPATVRNSLDGVSWSGSISMAGNFNNLVVAGTTLFGSGASGITRSTDGAAWEAAYAGNIGDTFHRTLFKFFGLTTENPARVLRTDNLAQNIEFIHTLSHAVTAGSSLLFYFPPSDVLVLLYSDLATPANNYKQQSPDGITWEEIPTNNLNITNYILDDEFVDSPYVVIRARINSGFPTEKLLITAIDNEQFTEADLVSSVPNHASTAPTNLVALNASWDGDNAEVTLQFQLANVPAEEITGIIIARDGVIVGTPEYTGDGTYEFTDTFESAVNPTPITYDVYVVSNTLDDISPSEELVVSGIPDITIVGSGQIDFGGSATVVLIGEPSGIYTLVKDKTHDTLYERQAGTTTSVNVKIPDPYIKTGFIGVEE